jgi:tetrahydromethanopterin S-methyltransferase subunit D
MWWAILVLISFATLALDIITGPYIQFPITFVVPVGLAAWHLGRWTGIGFAIVLVAARLGLAVTVDAATIPHPAAVINAVIRLVVLVGLAIAAEQLQHRRDLAARVRVLEGILPICSFCKKIRRADGDWEQIEAYVSQHSEAHFSHGLCEVCLEKHYPDSPGASGPSQRPNG